MTVKLPTASMEVRGYQRRAIDKCIEAFENGEMGVCLAAPPGAGKTFMASEIMRWFMDMDHACAFVVDRTLLAEQTWEEFSKFGLDPMLVRGSDKRPGEGPLVTTVQTQAARDFEDLRDRDLVIWDECHVQHKKVRAFLDEDDGTRFVLGLTATPMRRGMSDEYSALVTGTTSEELEGLGFLVPPSYFIVMKETLDPDMLRTAGSFSDYTKDSVEDATTEKVFVENAVEEYIRISRETTGSEDRVLRSIWFTATIAQGSMYIEEMEERGIKAMHFHDGDSNGGRRRASPTEVRQMLERGEVDALVNCEVLSKGTDFPPIECIVDARPRTPKGGRMSYVQSMTRGGRAYPQGDKTCYHVLDIAGNYDRHAGQFAYYRKYGVVRLLEKGDRADPKTEELQEAPCPGCGSVCKRGVFICVVCGVDLTEYCETCDTTLGWKEGPECRPCAKDRADAERAEREASQARREEEEMERRRARLERAGTPTLTLPPDDRKGLEWTGPEQRSEGGGPDGSNRMELPAFPKWYDIRKEDQREITGIYLGTIEDTYGRTPVMKVQNAHYKLPSHKRLVGKLSNIGVGKRVHVKCTGQSEKGWKSKDGETLYPWQYRVSLVEELEF